MNERLCAEVVDKAGEMVAERARLFRNQVVVVSALGVGVVVTSLGLESPAALLAWLVLIPACGLFFVNDTRVMNAWRASLLCEWTARRVHFGAVCPAIRANPILPPETLDGMLQTLPPVGDLVAEQQMLGPTRQAIAILCQAMDRERATELLLNVIASGVVVCLMLASVWLRTTWPLVGLASLVLAPVGRAWMRRRLRRRAAGEIAECRSDEGFSEADFERVCAAMRGETV